MTRRQKAAYNNGYRKGEMALSINDKVLINMLIKRANKDNKELDCDIRRSYHQGVLDALNQG